MYTHTHTIQYTHIHIFLYICAYAYINPYMYKTYTSAWVFAFCILVYGVNKNNSYFLLPKATALSPKTLKIQTLIIPFTDIDCVLAPNGQKDGVKE